ncbi:MAG: alpha/beta hydrolase [Solirubrobacterales bacterium]|nr:alpha/beta hydrolase [Solirubrobacterales bacterium]
MRRGWKILIALVIALAVLLAVNTVIVNNQTKEAEVTIEGGEIMSLPAGDVQVVEQGPELRSRPGAPIVLLHCYSCSLHWWDELAPLLARRHRVVRIDLLGHGGSQKPSSGYEIDEQAALVAGALDQLGVEGAVVVGHSMGFSVATALAQRASQLVDRVVNIGEGPGEDSCSVPFVARLGYVPVIGEAMWRLTPSFAIEDGYGSAFAPGYDISSGFSNPDQVVDDLRAMTYTAFRDAEDAAGDYVEAIPLDDRLRQTAVPLLSIFGTEDQICDPEESQAAYEGVPGARLAEIEGAGHSPNVEKPQETAALIEEFALDAGDEAIPGPPTDVGQRPGRDRGGN